MKKTHLLNGTRVDLIDYKDVETLRRFVNSQGKIYAPKRFNVTARTQRTLVKAIKRARHMGLLPFTIK